MTLGYETQTGIHLPNTYKPLGSSLNLQEERMTWEQDKDAIIKIPR